MEELEGTLKEGVLVADAGASKVDWAYGRGKDTLFFRSSGINPFFQDTGSIASLVEQEREGINANAVRRVFFYGAGCSSAGRKKRVEEGLGQVFPEAGIRVEHDLLGAARASAGDEASLVGILGTGSNACSYDGKRIVEQSGGLGYILGDEGSGAHMGKRLVRGRLNAEFSSELQEAFDQAFPQDREAHIEAIYRGNAPSRYLAAFAPFLKEQLDRREVRELVRSSFKAFIERHLLRLDSKGDGVLHTVGSIGHFFRPLLEEVLKEYDISPGRSVEEPIYGLIAYHRAG
ncbi:MAG: hypothetical protein ABEH38_02370 [Flavobacteriales bacterium]